jgi:hypothetical protein
MTHQPASLGSLPTLSSEPILHQDCCLSLSSGTIEKILTSLRGKNGEVLSIGSGSGLLEALLMEKCPELEIKGVEVRASTNTYLDEESFYSVRGTWDLCPAAQDASIWMFVYPRSPDLIKRYVERYGASLTLRAILWLGPKVDWETFEVCFAAACMEIEATVSLSPYETMVQITISR